MNNRTAKILNKYAGVVAGKVIQLKGLVEDRHYPIRCQVINRVKRDVKNMWKRSIRREKTALRKRIRFELSKFQREGGK